MDLLSSMPPYNFLGLEESNYKKSKVVVLPVPYDATTTYRTGSRDGPHAIIEASRQVELYNEEVGADISTIGIYTTEELSPNLDSPEKTINMIQKEVSLILDNKKFPVVIGGDHSVAIGAIRAVSRKYKEFSVLHFDAHSDSRNEYMGSRYCHACVMARAREVCNSCYSIGVRSTEETGFDKHHKETIYRKDMHSMEAKDIVKSLVSKTKEKVYITIDVDVLDPGAMPSTGTPEPDGLSFHELTSILKGVLKEKELVGLDVCELSPIGEFIAPNFLAAKLIYMTLGYAFFKGKK